MFCSLNLSLMLLCLAISSGMIAGGIVKFGDCNWDGNANRATSGSNNNEISRVIQLTFWCSHGYIDWRKPKGGLRIEFKPPMDAIGLEFTVRLLSEYPAVNIFEEAEYRLRLLRGSESHKPRTPMRIHSNNGSANLYLEFSDPSVEQVRLHYDVTSTSNNIWSKECSLCSAEKIADLYCNGDFAVKAEIENKYLHEDEKHVVIGLHVHHLFQQSSMIFLRSARDRHYIGHVTMPGKCSPPISKNHYIFLGKMNTKFGAFVQCYMRFSVWRMMMESVQCKS